MVTDCSSLYRLADLFDDACSFMSQYKNPIRIVPILAQVDVGVADSGGNDTD